MDDESKTASPKPSAPNTQILNAEVSPPQSPSALAEKNAAADSTNPILASPPMLRVSPPPSYTSGSFRRCDNKQPSTCVYCGNAGGAKTAYWERRMPTDRAAQSVRAMSLLGFALLFFVMFALIIYGNQHLFRQKPFSGWCGTSFVDQGKPKQFAQEMEIDPEELYEKIQVPKFEMNRPAVFVHDFRKNVTAIVDVLGDRCFLKPLDRSVVVPPKNFIDLLQKMESGYYAQNPRVIHETFRVGNRLDPEDLLDLGSVMVSRHCNNKAVFQLVPVIRNPVDSPYFVRDKRSGSGSRIPGTRQLRETKSAELQFSVLNGDSVGIERIIF
uniref:Integral membrane protein 2 n=1 Tax=Panagrolaimus sp. JU765 TaxID=591449 RepID=A0AC34R1Z5_9BILA